MSRRGIISALLALLFMAAPAAASEQSELLYSRGLVLFHQGRYPEALSLFQQAVAADPEDVYARYYRGMTEGRMGDYAAAAEDLREVLKAKPDLTQGALELGLALTETGDAAAAVPYLEEAQRTPALEAEASLLLAIAQIRLGNSTSALQNCERAAADPNLRVPATFYTGVATYQEGKWEDAADAFRAVVAESPDSEMGREAAAYLDTMEQGRRPTLGTKRYRLFGNVGFQYDSNVALIPNDGVLAADQEQGFGISGQQDGRAVIEVGGLWVPWLTETWELSVGYEFYQSLQFQLTQFNLQDNRPSVQLAANFEHFRAGVLTTYDYYLLQTDSFLQMVTAVPWVIVPEGGFGRTEVSYRFRYRDFYGTHFGIPFDKLFSSYNNQPGIRQFFYLGDPLHYAMLGYRYDNWDASQPAGAAFSFYGNEISTGLGWILPWQVAAEAGFAYEYEIYNPASKTFGLPPGSSYPGRRYDNQFQVFAGGTKPLNDYLNVTLAYYGIFNDSTQQPYSYDRNIVSLTVGVVF
jgi:tetratricopeptide (TPR) repeat protein